MEEEDGHRTAPTPRDAGAVAWDVRREFLVLLATLAHPVIANVFLFCIVFNTLVHLWFYVFVQAYSGSPYSLSEPDFYPQAALT